MIVIWSVVRNEAPYIEEMLRSVLGQTYRDWRLVVSDNYSTDGTGDIVRRYCDIDKRITMVHPPEPMGGMPHANWLHGQLVEHSNADAAMHIGGHDVISTDYVAELWTAMAANPGAVCTYPGTAYQIDEHSRIAGRWGSCPSTVGVAQPFRLLSMFTSMSHNIPFFGLMRWEAFKAVATTRCCTAHDHFVTAELTLHGEVLEVNGPTLLLRKSPGFGDPDVYRAKHLPGINDADDVRVQFEWLIDMVHRFCNGLQPDLETAFTSLALLTYVLSRAIQPNFLQQHFPDVYALLVSNVVAGRTLATEVQPCQ